MCICTYTYIYTQTSFPFLATRYHPRCIYTQKHTYCMCVFICVRVCIHVYINTQVGLGFLCQYTIMPLLGYSIVRLLQLPADIGAGVILVACWWVLHAYMHYIYAYTYTCTYIHTRSAEISPRVIIIACSLVVHMWARHTFIHAYRHAWMPWMNKFEQAMPYTRTRIHKTARRVVRTYKHTYALVWASLTCLHPDIHIHRHSPGGTSSNLVITYIRTCVHTSREEPVVIWWLIDFIHTLRTYIHSWSDLQ
jgi:hypothetical protein